MATYQQTSGPAVSPQGFTGTPQEIANTRRMANQLMQKGTSTAPVQHWTQALARVAQGGLGGYRSHQAGQMELDGQTAGTAAMAQALAGGSSKDAARSLMGNPYTAQQGQAMAMKAIGGREAAARQQAASQQALQAKIASENRSFGRQKHLIDYRAQNQGPTTFQRDYQFARQQGFQGTPADYKRSGAMSINVGAGAKAVQKGLGERYLKAEDASVDAAGQIRLYETMDRLLDNPETYSGSGGQAVAQVKKLGRTLLGMDIGGGGATEVARKITDELALGFKKQAADPQTSNYERQIYERMAVGLNDSAEGRKLMIKLRVADLSHKQSQAQIWRQHLQPDGSVNASVYQALAGLEAQRREQLGAFIDQASTVANNSTQSSPLAGVPDFAAGGRFKMNADGTFGGGGK